MIKRTQYLDRIRPYFDTDDIKVLVGIRRCGKSTILKQIYEELNTKDSNLIFYDFEDYDNAFFCKNPSEFYKHVKEQVVSNKKNYVFIDEVHYLDDYQQVVASIRSSLGCSIFITDSSSSIISGKLGTRFTGRYIEFLIMPFSFSEFVQITGKKGKEAFDYYLVHGGMPAQYDDGNQADDNYIRRLYDSILERDILARHGIKNIEEFKRIASYIMLSSGSTFSAESISDYLKSQQLSCSVPSLMNYVSYLNEAFLTSECKRFSIKGKQTLQTLFKNYAIDPSFISIQERTGNLNLGLVLETVVYNELISRGFEVCIGKTYNGEIDFIAKKDGLTFYYQVAYSLEKEDTQTREFGAFSSVKDSFPKYVISTDTIDFSRNGIKHLNIINFLLDK